MDDGRRRLSTNPGRDSRRLIYGHFGTSTFNTKKKEWSFIRQNQRGRIDTTPTFPPSLSFESDDSVVNSRYLTSKNPVSPSPVINTGINHPLQRLAKRHPDLGFVADFIPDDCSEAGPPGSRRLALAYAIQKPSRLRNPWIPIIVSPSRETPSAVRVNVLVGQKLRQKYVSDSRTGSSPQLSLEFLDTHLPQYGPVLQIESVYDFANGISIIAVRQALGSTLLLPVYTGPKKFLSEDVVSGLILARVSLKVILTVPHSRTGGQPHADLAVCCTGRNVHFAIVDTSGNWSVWNVRGKLSSGTRFAARAHLVSSGRIFAGNGRQHSSHSNKVLHGWHRLLFVEQCLSDEQTLLIYSRKRIQAFSKTGELLGDVESELVLGSRECILDVQTPSQDPHHVVLLTTSQLLLGTTSDRKTKPLHLVCSWKHFRSHSDDTLRMTLLELPNALRVILLSNQNKEVTVYEFSLHHKTDTTLVSARDPIAGQLPEQLVAVYNRVSQVSFWHMKLNSNVHDPHLKLLALLDDNTLFETTYRANQADTFRDSQFSHGLVFIPRFPRPHNKSSKFIHDDENEGNYDDEYSDYDKQQEELDLFITSDPQTQYQRLLAFDEFRSAATQPTVRVTPCTYSDWSFLLREATQQANDIDELSTKLLEVSMKTSKAASPLLDAEVFSEGPVHASEEITEAVEPLLLRLGTHAAALDEGLLVSLSENYDRLIGKHVKYLSSRVSDHERIRAARLSRFVAGDKVTSLSVPKVRQTNARSRGADETSNPDPQQELQAGQALQPQSTPAIDVLQEYTNIKRSLLTTIASPTVSKVLAHLPDDPSTDPSNYSYSDAELRYDLFRNEHRLQYLNDKTRRQHEKKNEASLRKQERQRRANEQSELDRPAIPSIAMSSQLPDRTSNSHRTRYGEAVSVPGICMTQPERGVFGTRPLERPDLRPPRTRQAGF